MGNARIFPLGPFIGGINNKSEASAVSENELIECQNLDINIDGILKARPNFEAIEGSSFTQATVAGSYYKKRTEVVGVSSVVFGDVNNDTTARYIYFNDILERYTDPDGDPVEVFVDLRALNTETGNDTTVRSDLRASVVLEYQARAIVIAHPDQGAGSVYNPKPGAPAQGGTWDGAVFTVDANMPTGFAAVVHKQRLWICAPNNVLFFTEPISVAVPYPLNWNVGINELPIGKDDGQDLLDLVIYNDTLMLFKERSTWVFAFDAVIAEGLLRVVNDKIGVSNSWSTVQYENATYVIFKGRVYQVVDYTFQDLNLRCNVFDPLVPNVAPEHLSIVDDRLLVKVGNVHYAYHLKVKAWTLWKAAETSYIPERFIESTAGFLTGTREFYAGTTDEDIVFEDMNQWDFLIKLETNLEERYLDYDIRRNSDASLTITNHPIEYKIVTKAYTFDDPNHYKKLVWWSADIETSGEVRGTAIAFNAKPYEVTWGEIADDLWGSLQQWIFAIDVAGNTGVASGYPNNDTYARRTYKFLKTIRFKRLLLTLSFTNQGMLSATNKTNRFYGISVISATKQTVEKGVN